MSKLLRLPHLTHNPHLFLVHPLETSTGNFLYSSHHTNTKCTDHVAHSHCGYSWLVCYIPRAFVMRIMKSWEDVTFSYALIALCLHFLSKLFHVYLLLCPQLPMLFLHAPKCLNSNTILFSSKIFRFPTHCSKYLNSDTLFSSLTRSFTLSFSLS